jgi:hypothetical protein
VKQQLIYQISLVMVLVIMQQMLHTQISGNLAGNGATNANNSNFFGSNLAGNAFFNKC